MPNLLTKLFSKEESIHLPWQASAEVLEWKKNHYIESSKNDDKLHMIIDQANFDGDKIKYTKKDIFDYDDSNKYDFIVLGEVLEHLDEPKQILIKLSKLLKPGGLLWITTPTNSPALDHVYLFKTKEEVLTLIIDSGLETVDSCNYFAEDMDEQTALKNKITNLVGLFCKNK